MLILTRNIGQSIKIGDDITVMILDVRGKQVRIGVSAPDRIEVHREEIYRRIQTDKLKTAEDKAKELAELYFPVPNSKPSDI